MRSFLHEEYLMDPEGRIYDDDKLSSYICIGRDQENMDTFTDFVANVGAWMHVRVLRDSKSPFTELYGAYFYDSRTLFNVVHILATTLAAIFPAITILLLHFVKNTLKRIYITMGLTTLFAFALVVFTKAKRIEIFAATAA